MLHSRPCVQVQLDVAAKVREGLSEVQKVSQMSLGLQHSMNTSLEMTVSHIRYIIRMLGWTAGLAYALDFVVACTTCCCVCRSDFVVHEL